MPACLTTATNRRHHRWRLAEPTKRRLGQKQGAPNEDGVGWTCSLDDGLFDGGLLGCSVNNFLCVTLA